MKVVKQSNFWNLTATYGMQLDFLQWLETRNPDIVFTRWSYDKYSASGEVGVNVRGKNYLFAVDSPKDWSNWKWLLRNKPGTEWVVWQRIQKAKEQGWAKQISPPEESPSVAPGLQKEKPMVQQQLF